MNVLNVHEAFNFNACFQKAPMDEAHTIEGYDIIL